MGDLAHQDFFTPISGGQVDLNQLVTCCGAAVLIVNPPIPDLRMLWTSPQNGIKGAGAHCAGKAARARRRGDRLGRIFLHESGNGPNAKCCVAQGLSAYRGRSEVTGRRSKWRF
jgi:hypothetical protein